MKILAIIPARGGSKGVPGKNIKLLNGKPLLQYTAEIAVQCTHFDKVVLSTDDTKISSVGRAIGLEVPFIRPAALSGDTAPTLAVIQHALNHYIQEGEHFDAVCLLQVTSPLRTMEFLNKAIETFIAKGTDSLISVREVPHEFNPHWTFELDDNSNLRIATGEKEIISRRQDLPRAFHRDGSIYLTKTSTILNESSLYGKSISHVESPKENYLNIDTMEDWNRAEKLMKNNTL